MSVSFGAHISDDARKKLKLHQDAYGFHNASDALEDVIKKMPTPKPVEKPAVIDPDQTTLLEHEK
jgi:hypothetical protein